MGNEGRGAGRRSTGYREAEGRTEISKKSRWRRGLREAGDMWRGAGFRKDS